MIFCRSLEVGGFIVIGVIPESNKVVVRLSKDSIGVVDIIEWQKFGI